MLPKVIFGEIFESPRNKTFKYSIYKPKALEMEKATELKNVLKLVESVDIVI